MITSFRVPGSGFRVLGLGELLESSSGLPLNPKPDAPTSNLQPYLNSAFLPLVTHACKMM